MARNKTFKLNREIGNAASRIQYVGSYESRRRAGLYTQIALSTPIANRSIMDERYAEEKFSQKNHEPL